MSAPGFLAGAWQQFFQRWEANKILGLKVDPSMADLVPAKPGYRIRVQWLALVLTNAPGVSLLVQDDAVSPLPVYFIDTGPGPGTYDMDFGWRGVPAGVSQALDLVASGAGDEGTLHMEGYYEPVGVFDLVTTKP